MAHSVGGVERPQRCQDMQTVSAGLIGCGLSGPTLARWGAGSRRAEPRWICTIDRGRLKGVGTTADYAEIEAFLGAVLDGKGNAKVGELTVLVALVLGAAEESLKRGGSPVEVRPEK